MRFAFTEEQEQLRDISRKFLNNFSTSKHIRDAADTERGWDPEIWQRVGQELGWSALAIPEEYGGFGFGQVEIIAVAEEMGNSLFCSPFLSSIGLAANAILLAGNESQKETYLPPLAAAEKTAALAWTGKSGDWSTSGIEGTCRPEGENYILNGQYRYVIDGHTADDLVVAAWSEHGDLTLFIVDSAANGLEASQLQTMDTTRKLAEVRLVDVKVSSDTLLGKPGDMTSVLNNVLDLGRTILAAEQVGVAQACLDMAVEYAKVREQFGTAIGSFQAIKHTCANMMLKVESARSAAYYAGWAATDRLDELHEAALVAQSYGSEICFECAADSIQVHGGIGFTWEHDAHLYFKRAKAIEELLGSPSDHRDLYGRDILGI